MTEKTVEQNTSAEAAKAYLKVAADHAERGHWLGAGANAAEAAKYFGIADRLAGYQGAATNA